MFSVLDWPCMQWARTTRSHAWQQSRLSISCSTTQAQVMHPAMHAVGSGPIAATYSPFQHACSCQRVLRAMRRLHAYMTVPQKLRMRAGRPFIFLRVRRQHWRGDVVPRELVGVGVLLVHRGPNRAARESVGVLLCMGPCESHGQRSKRVDDVRGQRVWMGVWGVQPRATQQAWPRVLSRCMVQRGSRQLGRTVSSCHSAWQRYCSQRRRHHDSAQRTCCCCGTDGASSTPGEHLLNSCYQCKSIRRALCV
jgi:hypothetical protein